MKLISVEEEYRKNDKLRPEDVKSLAEWMEKQPHLPNITDLELILFLHCTYYSIEAAKTVIDTYYSCRTHCPEFFENRNPNGIIARNMDVCTFYVLPKPTKENYKVIYVHLTDKDLAKFHLTELAAMFIMYVDLWLLREGTAPGHVILLDLDNVVLGHLTRLPIMAIKKFLFYLQEALPFRLTGVHVIHVVPFIDKIMAILRPFLKKELLDVLVFHTTGMDSLYKYIPKECLPEHLDGNAANEQQMCEQMKHELKSNADYFKEELKNRIDETKRPGKAKNAGDLFGIEGSFKKLEID